MQDKIWWVVWSCGRKLRVPLELCVTLGTRWCLLREVRYPLALQGAPQDSWRIAAGMNRASSRVEVVTPGFLYISDIDLVCLQSWNRGVRTRPLLRHGTPLAS